MAGHGGAHLFQPFLQRQGLAVLGQIVGDIADQAGDVSLAQQGRGFADQDRAGTKGLNHQAQRRQFVGTGGDPLGLGGIELDHLGQQQHLARDTALRHLHFHPFVDQPLVGRVLIDDHDAVPGLGHDVGLVHLGAGGPQREVDRVEGHRRRRSFVKPWLLAVRHGAGPILSRLRAGRDLGQAGDGLGGRLGVLRPAAHLPGGETLSRWSLRRPAWTQVVQGFAGDGGGRPVPGAGQDVTQTADDQAAHQGRIAEPHLGLGRMDVDVDIAGIDLKIERHQRVAVAGQEVGIGAAQRALQQAVAHRPAVHEQVLVSRVAAIIGRQSGEPGQPHALAFMIDGQGVFRELPSHDRRQAGQATIRPLALRRQAQGAATVQIQGERHILMRHCLALDLVGDRQRLGPLGLHELQAGGGGVEQVAHLNPGAVRAREAGWGDRAHRAAFDQYGVGVG